MEQLAAQVKKQQRQLAQDGHIHHSNHHQRPITPINQNKKYFEKSLPDLPPLPPKDDPKDEISNSKSLTRLNNNNLSASLQYNQKSRSANNLSSIENSQHNNEKPRSSNYKPVTNKRSSFLDLEFLISDNSDLLTSESTAAAAAVDYDLPITIEGDHSSKIHSERSSVVDHNDSNNRTASDVDKLDITADFISQYDDDGVELENETEDISKILVKPEPLQLNKRSDSSSGILSYYEKDDLSINDGGQIITQEVGYNTLRSPYNSGIVQPVAEIPSSSAMSKSQSQSSAADAILQKQHRKFFRRSTDSKANTNTVVGNDVQKSHSRTASGSSIKTPKTPRGTNKLFNRSSSSSSERRRNKSSSIGSSNDLYNRISNGLSPRSSSNANSPTISNPILKSSSTPFIDTTISNTDGMLELDKIIDQSEKRSSLNSNSTNNNNNDNSFDNEAVITLKNELKLAKRKILQLETEKNLIQDLTKLKKTLKNDVNLLSNKKSKLLKEIIILEDKKSKTIEDNDLLNTKYLQLTNLHNELIKEMDERYTSMVNEIDNKITSYKTPGTKTPGKASSSPKLHTTTAALQETDPMLEEESIISSAEVIDTRKERVHSKPRFWKRRGAAVAKGFNKVFTNENNLTPMTTYGSSYDDASNGSTPVTVLSPSTKTSGKSNNNGLNIVNTGSNKNGPKPPEPPEKIFGAKLIERTKLENSKIPFIVIRCIEEVELKGLEHEGLYRKSGGKSQMETIENAFINTIANTNKEDENKQESDSNDNKTINHDDLSNIISNSDIDINAITSVLKKYFRYLPEPIITNDTYDNYIKTSKLNDKQGKIQHLNDLVHSLPIEHYETLKYLMKHLNHVSLFKDINLMNTRNLAVVFAPTLARDLTGEREIIDMQPRNEATQLLIENAEEIFNDNYKF